MAIENEYSTQSSPLNPDPLTGEPGAHPVGTGVGAVGGAVTGAAIGAAGGPVGAAVGMAAGAVVGGLGGKAVAERVNPTAEDAYWRDAYNREAYYRDGRSYDDYRPAYELGWSSRARSEDSFDLLEPSLATEWNLRRGNSGLAWDDARPATRAAWDRADSTYYADGFETSDMVDDNDDVVDVLNDLLENSRDGEYGFTTLAEEVEASALKTVFLDRAAQCREAARELADMVIRYGGKPAEGGTVSGAMHRGWVHVKGAVGANSEQSMLDECERGEDAAVARYREALKNNLPMDVLALVERQAQGAKRNHDQMKMLRDQPRP